MNDELIGNNDLAVEADSSAQDEVPVQDTLDVASEWNEASETAETPVSPETDGEALLERAETSQAPETPKAPTESPAKPTGTPYHERAYLRYGNAEQVGGLDLAATSAFLLGMGFDGGELRQAREGKNLSDTLRGQADPSIKYCSYCGAEVSGVDYYRLPDGRLRCTTCSNTLVKTKADLLSIYNKVISDMETFFGAQLRVPIQIEMLEERKLKKKINSPLSDVDNNALLILGVAVNKRGKYSIYLENGAPRISAIATFIHELTHIWQYVYWEKNKLPKLKGAKQLLVYEGMAKWVEIQYLYLIGETEVAKREEAHTLRREDVYGIGFNLYLQEYPLSREAMHLCENPFTTDRYPIG